MQDHQAVRGAAMGKRMTREEFLEAVFSRRVEGNKGRGVGTGRGRGGEEGGGGRAGKKTGLMIDACLGFTVCLSIHPLSPLLYLYI